MLYMAGTPKKTVGSTVCNDFNVPTVEHASSMAIDPPEYVVGVIKQCKAAQWNIGVEMSILSDSCMARASCHVCDTARKLRWVNITPFGFPVVPDVYIIVAVSF